MSEDYERHESYGMVGLFRTSGQSGPLFGSSIQHRNFITLRVSRAKRRRELNNHWYSADQEILELVLSPTQFADLVTCMNVGDGVPCTLRYVNGKRMAGCPDYMQRQQFEDEFRTKCESVMDDAAELLKSARDILAKTSILKADRAELLGRLSRLEQEVRSNMPFVQTQFNEAMERTVTEAKGEVEAFVQNKVTSLGVDALRRQFGSSGVPMIEAPAIPDAVRD